MSVYCVYKKQRPVSYDCETGLCVYVIRQYVYISISLKYCNCRFCVARAVVFKFEHQGG